MQSLRFLLAPLALALLASGLSGCEDSHAASGETALPYYAEATFTPLWYASPEAVPDTMHAIAPFALTDQNGETLTEADLDGGITIANFFFTSCPGICPATMANMAKLQTTFAEDGGVALLSHSITPERDSVEALQEFAQRMNVLDATWHLVTGSRETMYALGKRSYFADEDLGVAPEALSDDAALAAAFTHTESFFLIDRQRRIRGIYNGMNSAAVTQLIADVQTLQAEP